MNNILLNLLKYQVFVAIYIQDCRITIKNYQYFKLTTMNKKTIITLILAIVAAISTRAIDAKHFYSGTAVLKGRILNKPADEWNVLTVHAYNEFSAEEEVIAIPVAYDGSFEANIHLLHSKSIYIVDNGQVFLAVGDTLELTKDAAQEEYKGFTFAGNNTSAVINRLWPELSKHYYGEEGLFIKGLERDKMPAWKKSVLKKLDAVIADIEADRLPLPANTTDFEKEVLGASLLSEPLMAMMENYRLNITGGNYSKMNIAEFKNSVLVNCGYYIGRYEARTTVARNNKEDMLAQITEKGIDHVYNYVTQQQAASKSQNMYSSNKFTSDLMNSFAWDTAITFIQVSEIVGVVMKLFIVIWGATFVQSYI